MRCLKLALLVLTNFCLAQPDEVCKDGRSCSEVYRFEDPCIEWVCPSLCYWGDPSQCDYQITPGQDECPAAICTAPPTPPTPPSPKEHIFLTVGLTLTGITATLFLGYLGWKYFEPLKTYLVTCLQWLLQMFSRIASVRHHIRPYFANVPTRSNSSAPLDDSTANDSDSDDTRSSVNTPSPNASPTIWSRYRTLLQQNWRRSPNTEGNQERQTNSSLWTRGRRYFQRLTSTGTEEERQPLIRFRRVQDGQGTVEMANILRDEHTDEDELGFQSGGIQNENYNEHTTGPIIRQRTPPPPYQTSN